MTLDFILFELQKPLHTDVLLEAAFRNAHHEVLPDKYDNKRDREWIAGSIDCCQMGLKAATNALQQSKYLGLLAYYQTLQRVHAAADIVGPNNLPDIPLPERYGPTLEWIAKTEQFGKDLFEAAAKANSPEVQNK